MPTVLSSTDLDSCEIAAFAGGEVAYYTHRAPAKEGVNQDSVAFVDCGGGSGVLAIADGAGGMRAGEQASRTTLEVLMDTVRGAAERGEPLRDGILTGIERANRAVLDLGLGAVTTLAVAEIAAGTVRTYHVGDSVILVVGQRGKIKLQTIAHSPVGYAVEAGVLDEGEAMHHEERHLVSNFIGTPDMRVEIGSTLQLAPRDTVLLASDGLADNLHTDEIVQAVRSGPLLAALTGLVERARARMLAEAGPQPCKPDDLSVLLFRAGVPQRRAGG